MKGLTKEHIKSCIRIIQHKGCIINEQCDSLSCIFYDNGPLLSGDCQLQSYSSALKIISEYTEEELQEVLFEVYL